MELNEENKIGKASSEQDRKTAIRVPIVKWPFKYKEEATIEVPHSGIKPKIDPTTGPNFLFPFKKEATLSSTKEKTKWKTKTKANIFKESSNESINTSNMPIV